MEGQQRSEIQDGIDRFDFRAVHPLVFFATASDRYAGWIGQIYGPHWESTVKSRKRTLGGKKFEERTVPVASVGEYFDHFGALELDFTFYRTLLDSESRPTSNYFVLQNYADSAPDSARFYLKAPQQISARMLRRGRKGTVAYEPNPEYLDSTLFMDRFLIPGLKLLGKRFAGVIFEQEYQRKSESPPPEQHLDQLNTFFLDVVDEPGIHLEIRSPHLLTPEYFDWLGSRGLGQVFSHWTWLPSLSRQFDLGSRRLTSSNGDVLIRLLTPLRMPYARAYEHAHPFDRSVPLLCQTPQAQAMVADTAEIALESLKQDRAVTIISNNRAWGNAPSLAQKVAGSVLDELEQAGQSRQARP
jgi:Protein of unknown function DUF72